MQATFDLKLRVFMIYHPLPEDILPRQIIFTADVVEVANALLPWAKRNPVFTLLCAIEASGMKVPEDVVRHEALSTKVQQALRKLGCFTQGKTEAGVRIWHLPPDAAPIKRLEIPSLQVEVSRAWLREFYSPSSRIHRRFTSDAYRRLVTAWTKATGAYLESEQHNVHTGERYYSESVYVSNDAFIKAALEEGYTKSNVPHSQDAYFNIGKKHRAKVKARLQVKVKVKVKLLRWLAQAPPLFRLKDVPKMSHKREELRRLGYAHRVMLVKGRRGSLWYKVADQPWYAR